MRSIVLLLALITFFLAHNVSFAQTTESGPIIKEYGKVFSVPDAKLKLSNSSIHKVIFDVYTDLGGEKEMNPLLTTVARFMNMHGQTGVSNDQMQIVVIMHGAALKNALNDEAYQKKYNRPNPNSGLMKALQKSGVNLFACGQSLYSRGHQPEELSESVQLSLSAMTALVHYQEEGYSLINFN